MGIGFEKNKNLELAKQPSAEFLKLTEPALSALTAEIKSVIQATSNMRR
jgi:hypothetical protein